MATNDNLRQASVRASTGTAYAYNDDWLALFRAAGITTGGFNDRMKAWINGRLGTSYVNVNDAMKAFAANQGFTSWGEMGSFTASGTPDTTPDAFTFTDETGATLSTVYTSNSIVVTGVNSPSTISITGGTYSINGGAYTSASGSVILNDSISVRATSSGSNSTAINAVLTIGGVSDTYTVTTQAAGDTTPDAFTFTDVTSATLSTVYTSNAITVAGINAAAAISITGGTYSVNGGAYTSTSGSVVLGDSVTVRVTSSGSNSTAVNVVLTIGGVSDTYTVTTVAASGANRLLLADGSSFVLQTDSSSKILLAASVTGFALLSGAALDLLGGGTLTLIG